MNAERHIHIGVAGWSYPDWRDTVYRLPPTVQQGELFASGDRAAVRYADDDLAYLSRYVDMIEINSSFYRIPSPRHAAAWARRVAQRPGFFFTAKLNREFTHEFRCSRPAASEFRAAMMPLIERGLLRAILAQFRHDFADSAPTRRLLEWIGAQFGASAPLVVEVRHKSWENDEALEFMRRLGVTVAHLDYPVAADSFDMQTGIVGEHAYLRLHGRNRTAWFAKDADVNETYNYDYSDQEVAELAQRSRNLLLSAQSLTVVANNHYQGKAVSAALRLKAAMTGKTVAVPPALLETYPLLKRLAD